MTEIFLNVWCLFSVSVIGSCSVSFLSILSPLHTHTSKADLLSNLLNEQIFWYSVVDLYIAEHPELYKGRGAQLNEMDGKSTETNNSDAARRRQTATDEFMLERFRKRERNRVMRR